MRSHAGCLTHTLRSRASDKIPNAIEFRVEFLNKAFADECEKAMRGKPFASDNPEQGDVIIAINPAPMQTRPISVPLINPVRPVNTGHTKPKPLPVLTRENFDIGERPCADVSARVLI